MRLVRAAGLAVAILVAVACVLAFAAWLASRPPPIARAPVRVDSLDDVVLVTPRQSEREVVRLVLEAGRISSVEAAFGSGGEFSGAYVVPGLVDTHLHMPIGISLPGDQEYTALLLLANGVTSARLLGGTSAAVTADLRDRIDSGEIPGPRLFTCGPIIDGPDRYVAGNDADSVSNAEQARALVGRLASEGVDCIKVYDRLNLESVTALREAAHSHGLPVVGHTPQDVTLEAARLDDVQHLRGVHPPFEDEGRTYPEYVRPWLRMDDARFDHVLAVSREHDMTYTPTMVAVESMVRARKWDEWSHSPAMRAWPSHLRDAVFSAEVGVNPGRFMSDEQVEMVRTAFATMRRTAVRLHEAGVPLHTGTDANVPNVVPGHSLRREVELWVESGISPDDALYASGIRSAAALGVVDADRSRFSPGQPADFAIFSEDPTRDIAALDTLLAVVADGRLYRRQDLDERLARYVDHYDSWSYRTFVVGPLRLVARGVTYWLRPTSIDVVRIRDVDLPDEDPDAAPLRYSVRPHTPVRPTPPDRVLGRDGTRSPRAALACRTGFRGRRGRSDAGWVLRPWLARRGSRTR